MNLQRLENRSLVFLVINPLVTVDPFDKFSLFGIVFFGECLLEVNPSLDGNVTVGGFSL